MIPGSVPKTDTYSQRTESSKNAASFACFVFSLWVGLMKSCQQAMVSSCAEIPHLRLLVGDEIRM